MRNRDLFSLILILILTGFALWIDFAPGESWLGRDVRIRLGLDLQGGTQVLLRAENPAIDSETMQTAKGVIERRVNGLGVNESVVQVSGSDRIIVELPGVRDPNQAVETLRGTGRLEFIDTGGQFLNPGTIVRTSGNPNPQALMTVPTPTINPLLQLTPLPQATLTPTGAVTETTALSPTATLAATAIPTNTAVLSPTIDPNIPIFNSITDGRDLDTRSVQLRAGGSQTTLDNQYGVAFGFTGSSATRLEQFTSQNVQKPMCIVLDNVVFSCPVIQTTLIGGSGEITTGTRTDAERIYNQLKYGALPVSFQVESSRTVSATLGRDSVDASVIAGVVGLIAVILFLILYYRLPGLIATLVLLIYTAVIFAIYKLIPVTLTLPGIAGFILSIGVIVDANVLIAGRFKEELRKGRQIRSAVETGFDEAWSAILDSSVAMLITSVILFLFGSSFGVSLITGFAVTLGLGTLISLGIASLATRTFLRLLALLPFANNPWLYDLEVDSGSDQDQQSRYA